jgi:hypothetical protein
MEIIYPYLSLPSKKCVLEVIDLVSDVQDVVQYKASSEPRLNSLPQPIFHYSKVCSSPHKGFTISRYCHSPGAIRYHYIEILPLAGLQTSRYSLPSTVLLDCQRPVSSTYEYVYMSPFAKFPLHKDIATTRGHLYCSLPVSTTFTYCHSLGCTSTRHCHSPGSST